MAPLIVATVLAGTLMPCPVGFSPSAIRPDRSHLLPLQVTQPNDPVVDGVVLGALAGAGTAAGFTAWAFASCDAGCEAPSPGPTYALAAGIGAATGAVIGWLLDRLHKPRTSSARGISVAPLLTRERKALAVAASF